MDLDFDPVRQAVLTVLCLNQVAVNWLAGNKSDFAWILGTIGFAPWAAYIVFYGEWGMVPFVAFVQIVYVRNLLKTRRERHALAAPAAAATAPRSRPA